MELEKEVGISENRGDDAPLIQVPPRRVILNVSYDKFLRELEFHRKRLGRTKAAKQHAKTNGSFWPYDNGKTEYDFRRDSPEIDIPHPLREISFALIVDTGKLSGFTNITGHSIGEVREELNQALKTEALRRNLFWADAGSGEGRGYLLNQVQIGGASESLAILGACEPQGDIFRYSVSLGMENGCKNPWPIRNREDFMQHVAPLTWITQTVINTYMETAERRGKLTLDEHVPSLKLNILL